MIWRGLGRENGQQTILAAWVWASGPEHVNTHHEQAEDLQTCVIFVTAFRRHVDVALRRAAHCVGASSEGVRV